jgi:hypothetical protein
LSDAELAKHRAITYLYTIIMIGIMGDKEYLNINYKSLVEISKKNMIAAILKIFIITFITYYIV